jgi:dipeptidyl aminopeptidase/acylaminoacyl peptidase
MAHPDWLGRQPEQAFWGLDSNAVNYSRKQEGNELRDTFTKTLSSEGNGSLVALDKLHTLGAKQLTYNADNTLIAYTFKGNVFIKNTLTGELKQLTMTDTNARQLMFLTTGELAYRVSNNFYKIDPNTGFGSQIASLKTQDKPADIAEPTSYSAKAQHKLIDYVALTHKNNKDAKSYNDAVNKANPSVMSDTYYFGKDNRIVNATLSPAGDKLIVVVTKSTAWRDKGDIMPNYIGQNGEIVAEKVRRRVADSKPSSSDVILLDLTTNTQQTLAYNTLPGFDEDVLADVKKENWQAQGKTYKSEKKNRDINLIMDWGWSQSAVQWNKQGTQVAVMLEAWDNKDRWIATVDFDQKTFVSQHRLSDKAWVNYTYNNFGWVNSQTDTLYYLSEQSGYSHIYSKALSGKATQLSSGQYVVSELTQARKSPTIYYKANKKHPGVYEIYQLNLETGKSKPVTDLNGMTDYQLSPDEQKLLLTHSKLTLPTELYVAELATNKVSRLTNTVSKQFSATQLITPKIVAVPSSHTDQPIYAKVYYPADYKEGEGNNTRKAVIFNHGAGYLQNSHYGWSGYFREFMFHSFLAQQGYVVMDMDYRASKGYGRDWRTAIYRQMGTPEIEDLADGIAWMKDNANVDSQKVGTYGGSYGGFMTFMALLKRPELFQAGAALRPVSDWAYYNNPYTSNILNHPDIDPIAYERSSPIYFAEGLEKPLLINAPMVDDNVFFQDVVRLVQRFIELEKENFETAIYPVEPHGFKQPSSWLDEYRRIYKLFEQNL